MKLIDKIKQLEFQESDLDTLLVDLSFSIDELKRQDDLEEQKKWMDKINALRDHYLTLYWCSYLGYLKDITDEKYQKSEELFGSIDAKYNHLVYSYFDFLDKHKEDKGLNSFLPPRTFALAENQMRLSSDDNIELIKREKELCRAYRKLIVGTYSSFNGEKVNANKLMKYYKNKDSKVRKKAYDKRFEILTKISSELANIADELIHIRNEMAHQLGLSNYKEYGFIKMNRLGYDEKDLILFKRNIKKYFVPLLKQLAEHQCQRLQIDKIDYYDEKYLFSDGNASVDLSLKELLEKLKGIFKELDAEIYHLFIKMEKEGLIDLEDRDTKSAGGLSTYLPDYQMPTFIKKYLGVEENITSISHEFGHCTQLFLSKDKKYHENRWPTFDICEIHSTSMELFIYPYLDIIFKENISKYCISHLTSLIDLVVKMCAIDEFNSCLYEHPSYSHHERNELWKKIYAEYYPHHQYKHEYYESGIMWQSDLNRIDDPFYAIDYSLDAICAFSFYQKSLENKESAFDLFLDFCKEGGDISLKEIIENYQLLSPFEEKDIHDLCAFLEQEIKKYSMKLER